MTPTAGGHAYRILQSRAFVVVRHEKVHETRVMGPRALRRGLARVATTPTSLRVTRDTTVSMPKISAGILPYRRRDGQLEVLLIHPGGPFWARKDLGAWSVAKGLVEEGEAIDAAARREFTEETGFIAGPGLVPLTPRRQAGGKTIHVWAVEGDFDPAALRSVTFTVELPKGSGRFKEFPEADRAAWFPIEEARRRILTGQVPFLDELEKKNGAA